MSSSILLQSLVLTIFMLEKSNFLVGLPIIFNLSINLPRKFQYIYIYIYKNSQTYRQKFETTQPHSPNYSSVLTKVMRNIHSINEPNVKYRVYHYFSLSLSLSSHTFFYKLPNTREKTALRFFFIPFL